MWIFCLYRFLFSFLQYSFNKIILSIVYCTFFIIMNYFTCCVNVNTVFIYIVGHMMWTLHNKDRCEMNDSMWWNVITTVLIVVIRTLKFVNTIICLVQELRVYMCTCVLEYSCNLVDAHLECINICLCACVRMYVRSCVWKCAFGSVRVCALHIFISSIFISAVAWMPF